MKWNEYRKKYPDLTFKEKKRLIEHWYTLYPKQTGYARNLPFFIGCIDKVIKQTKRKNLSLVEYGGHDGGLAALVMQKHNQLNWVNVDIIPHTVKEQLENYNYREHVLEDEFWVEKPSFKNYDVFLSSSTLEHISDEEIIQLFDYIRSQEIKYLILLVTTTPNGSNWENYGGAHVLRTGSTGLKKMLSERGYKLLEDDSQRIKWCSFWRL